MQFLYILKYAPDACNVAQLQSDIAHIEGFIDLEPGLLYLCYRLLRLRKFAGMKKGAGKRDPQPRNFPGCRLRYQTFELLNRLAMKSQLPTVADKLDNSVGLRFGFQQGQKSLPCRGIILPGKQSKLQSDYA